MTIFIDTPMRLAALNQRLGPSSHLVSDLPGEEGSKELDEFAQKIGMKRSWLQKAGTRHEHYDVFGARYDAAIRAGAKAVTCSGMGRIFRAKKTAEEAEKKP